MICCKKLQNGVRVVYEKMEHYRSVSMGVWVRAGSVWERKDEWGISHFIEHMLFKGTLSRSAGEIAAEMDMIGGNLNAFTAKECTCFYAKVLDEHIGRAADMLSDIVLRAKLSAEDIEREKGVVCEEILMTEDSPEDVAHEALCSLLYDGSPLGRAILGTEETVNGFGREMIDSYMARRYLAENIVIACAGSFEEDKLMEELNARFASVLPGGGGAAEWGKMGEGRRVKAIEKDIGQYHICFGFPGFSIEDDRRYALLVLNNILGGAMSSRLFQKVREERGLAYSIYSYPTSYAGSGYFTLYAGTGEKTAPRVAKLMLDEIRDIKKRGISADELIRAKDQLRCSYALGQESTSSHSSAIGKSALLLGSVMSEEELLMKLEGVTMGSIDDIIPIVLNEDGLCASIVGKLGKTSKEIEKLVL